MTEAFSVQTTIDRPAAEVWAALTRSQDAPIWMSGIDSMVADDPTEVGTELRFVARGKERRSEIVAVEEGRSVVLRSVHGGVSADYGYGIEPLDEWSARVSLVAECSISGDWAPVAPLMRYVVGVPTVVRPTHSGAGSRWIERPGVSRRTRSGCVGCVCPCSRSW